MWENGFLYSVRTSSDYNFNDAAEDAYGHVLPACMHALPT